MGQGSSLRWLYCVFLTLSSGLHETLALLTSQLRPDSNHKEEMGFLRDVFSEKSLSYLMKVKSFLPQEGLSLCCPLNDLDCSPRHPHSCGWAV